MKTFLLCFLGLNFVTANTFTSAVYKQVIERKQGNFMVSPLSVQAFLSLLQSGSKGPTAEELGKSCHLLDPGTLLKVTGNAYTFKTANKIYIKNSLTVKSEFRKSALEAGSEIEEIDFSDPAVTAKINQWVEKKTENKIHDVVDENLIDNKTQAVIINALYFNASWAKMFPPMTTKKSKFYKTNNEEVEVETMFLEEEEFLYYDSPRLEAALLELPFKGEDASMTIVLPHNRDGLKTLETKIEEVFGSHNFTREVVTIALPKFKIDSKFDLKRTLKSLGVQKIFDRNEADLSGISGKPGDLIVSKIFQKTFVDVNERGVEVAASTFIPAIVPTMGSVVTPKMFVVDHPFIFFIRVKGLVLFAGRVTTPNYQ